MTEGSDRQEEPRNDRGKLGWLATVLVCLLVLAAGAGVTYLIFSTEPAATRGGATKQTAMLVEVTRAERGTFRPEISATGTVIPAQDITLSPRVSGEIVERSENFTPGGFVEKGEVLLRIDPADFRNVLLQRESELRRAEAALKIEMGRQQVAKQGYELLDEDLSPENESLVLREPQLNTARADVEAARAAVDQARLDLERTEIRAPFAAHVLARNANVGSQVSPTSDLGRLVGTSVYWVEVTVPLSKLQRLSFPENGESPGSPVRLRNDAAWRAGVHREGHLFRLIGALSLEDRTRLARVLVTVEDPLQRGEGAPDGPPLIVGEFLEAHIKGDEVSDVIRLGRDYVHKNDTVWVMNEDETLEIREVEVAFTDEDYAYIESGLEEDDLVVTTNLSTVVDGAKLRLSSPSEATSSDSETSPESSTE